MSKITHPGDEYTWMTIREVAAEVPCSIPTVHEHAGRNGFPPLYEVAGKYRIRRSEWREYMASPPRVPNKILERSPA
jgi:hypothetical protein